jgi:hypothetical protein
VFVDAAPVLVSRDVVDVLLELVSDRLFNEFQLLHRDGDVVLALYRGSRCRSPPR